MTLTHNVTNWRAQPKRVHLFMISTATVFSFAVVQVGMGSSVFLAATFLFISVTCLLFLLPKKMAISDFLMLMFGFYFGVSPLLIKTMIGQNLETNMVLPMESAFFLTMTFVAICAAAILARTLTRGHASKISRRMNWLGEQRHLLVPILLFGLTARFLFILAAKSGSSYEFSGLGGGGFFNLFLPVLQFGLVMTLYQASRGLKMSKTLFIIVVVTVIVLGIVSNAKKELVFALLPIFVAAFSFGLRWRLKYALPAMISCYILLAIVVPSIQIARNGLKDVPFTDRLELTWKIAADNNFSPTGLAGLQSDHLSSFQYSYGEYRSYVYPSAANVDRFLAVFQVDQIVRKLHTGIRLDGSVAVNTIANMVLPSFLVEKQAESVSDKIAWDWGIRSRTSVARPVMGIAASSAALGGIWSAVLVPFVLLFLFMTIANYLFGPIRNSLFAAVGCGVVAPYVEKVFSNYAFAIFREFILLWIIFSLIYAISIFFSRPNRLITLKQKSQKS